MTVFIPKKYSGTALNFIILMHELEHQVQDAFILEAIEALMKSKNLVGEAREFAIWDAIGYIEHSPQIRLAAERGAMMSEWYYLSLLPKPLKDKLIKSVRNETTWWKYEKRFPFLVLTGNQQKINTSRSYVADQQRRGRYPKSEMPLFFTDGK